MLLRVVQQRAQQRRNRHARKPREQQRVAKGRYVRKLPSSGADWRTC